MPTETFLILSFRAAIAFGLLALAGLMLAAVAWHQPRALWYALAAAGTAYLAQSIATHAVGQRTRLWLAVALQVLSSLLWLYGLHLVTGV